LEDSLQHSNCRLFFLFSLLLLLAYSNSFQVAWQLDDSPNILTNYKQQITELSFNQIWDAMTALPSNPEAGGLSRPVSRVSLGLNWFWGGDNVFGYHVVNFFIHLGASGLLFLVINTLFATPRLRGHYPPGQVTFIAITATLFWALNPVQVQAVTYIVQRMTSLAAFFSLLSIFCYLKLRLHDSDKSRILWLLGAITSYSLAFLSKENACLLPLSLIVLEIVFFQLTFFQNNMRSLLLRSSLAICLCLAVTIALSPGVFKTLLSSYDVRPFTLWQRVLTEQRIIVFYLSLLIFPHPARLSVQHDILLSTSLFSPITTVFSICFNVLLFVFALKSYRRQPLFTLAIVFFYINHIVESTVLQLELLFEHRNYLPSLFFFIPLAQLCNYLLDKSRGERLKTFFIVVVITTIITTLAFATFTRNKAWQTVESLWLDAAEKAPNSARPLSSLAMELGWGNNRTGAKTRKALQLQELSLKQQKNSSIIDSKIMGNIAALNVHLDKIDEALSLYQEALRIDPKELRLRYNYSKLLLWTGEFEPAMKEISTVLISAGYQHPDYWNLLAMIDIWSDHPEQALISLQRALRKAPNRPDVNLHLAKCLSMLGSHQRARFFYRRSIDNGGGNNILYLSLIENSLLDNDIPQAQADLRRAINNYPIPYLLKPLMIKPDKKRYNTIPLDEERLKSFIFTEVPQLIDPTDSHEE